MAHINSCPACALPLGLFTPRESTSHVNACLDSQTCATSGAATLPAVECGVCTRDLSALTAAARTEHANRCADGTLPLRPARARSSRVLAAPAPKPRGDPAVRSLLELLGLARYTERFASEEIDLDALRLLDDPDFVQMRIPDAARRRIAEALHSVPILEQIRSRPQNAPASPGDLVADSEDLVVPTQQFQKSELGSRMRSRAGPLLLLEESSSSDDEDEDLSGKESHGPVPVKAQCASQKPAEDDAANTGTGPCVDTSNIEHTRFEREGSNDTGDNVGTSGRTPGVESSTGSASGMAGLVRQEQDFDKMCEPSSTPIQDPVVVSILNRRCKALELEVERHRKRMDAIRDHYTRELDSYNAGTSLSLKAPLISAGGSSQCGSDLDAPCRIGYPVFDAIDLTQVGTPSGDRRDSNISHPSSPKRPRRQNSEVNVSPEVSSIAMLGLPTLGTALGARCAGDKVITQCSPEPVPSSSGSERGEASDDELMDLTCAPTVSGLANGENAVSATNHILSSSGETALNNNVSSALSSGSTKPSRLKKQQKVTSADILSAIRGDMELYDRILLLESVPIEQVFACVRNAGLLVPLKTVSELLKSQGIAFKGVSAKNHASSADYFANLNSAFYPQKSGA